MTGLGLTLARLGASTASLRLTLKFCVLSVVPLLTVTVQVRLPVQVSVLATTVGCTPSDDADCVTIWVKPVEDVQVLPLLVQVDSKLPASYHLMVLTVSRLLPLRVSIGE